jgi:hypothetical protein
LASAVICSRHGELGHSPAVAEAAEDAAPFRGKWNQHIVAAACAPGMGKTMAQGSTRQVLAELALDILGHGLEVRISLPTEVRIGLEAVRHKLYPGQDRFDRTKQPSPEPPASVGVVDRSPESLYAEPTRFAYRAVHERSPFPLPPDTERVDLRDQRNRALLPGSGVAAQPVAAWRKRQTYVTAVRLLNQRPSR